MTDTNSYRRVLEAAGAIVRDFREFGSYQGDWFAVLADGTVIAGTYGSCSECDAFESEFDCKEPTPEQLAAFGREYLDDPQDIQTLIAHHAKNAEWDEESQAIVDWLTSLCA